MDCKFILSVGKHLLLRKHLMYISRLSGFGQTGVIFLRFLNKVDSQGEKDYII